MDTVVEELIGKFDNIKKQDWIQSTRSHNTGIGKTFEDLLDKQEDNLSEPDYKGIEIKTKRQFSNSYTTLITKSPEGNSPNQNTRLRLKYGHKENSSQQTLHSSIFATRMTTYFNSYKFKISIDREEERIYLEVYDLEENLIEKEVYWTFDILKNILNAKLKKMALIYGDSKKIVDNEYFKFNKIQIYDFTDFEKFLQAIENGKIMVDLRIGYYKSGKNIGKTHDHGTGFRIKSSDILDLFTLITEKE
jgi:hypothetical protein